jgi:hypothetical protein
MAGAEGVSEMAEIVVGFSQRELRLLHTWHTDGLHENPVSP